MMADARSQKATSAVNGCEDTTSQQSTNHSKAMQAKRILTADVSGVRDVVMRAF